jgi:hypothetical protein
MGPPVALALHPPKYDAPSRLIAASHSAEAQSRSLVIVSYREPGRELSPRGDRATGMVGNRDGPLASVRPLPVLFSWSSSKRCFVHAWASSITRKRSVPSSSRSSILA